MLLNAYCKHVVYLPYQMPPKQSVENIFPENWTVYKHISVLLQKIRGCQKSNTSLFSYLLIHCIVIKQLFFHTDAKSPKCSQLFSELMISQYSCDYVKCLHYINGLLKAF